MYTEIDIHMVLLIKIIVKKRNPFYQKPVGIL